MPKSKQKTSSKEIYKLSTVLAGICTAVLLTVAGLAWWAHSYVSNMVRTELAAQKVYFPPKGSPALSPEEFPDLQQYAGELVDTGPEARAYANGFIGRHLKKVAGGKVYAEVSAEAQKDPTNAKLQQQRQSLFQGETLRAILLGNGFAFWTIAEIAKIASFIALAAAVVTGALTLVFAKRSAW